MSRSDSRVGGFCGPIELEILQQVFLSRPSVKFDFLLDSYFYTSMLNQDVGAWGRRALATDPAIWSRGGTNQANVTAMKFPKATLTGSGVSAGSLQICENTAVRRQRVDQGASL